MIREIVWIHFHVLSNNLPGFFLAKKAFAWHLQTIFGGCGLMYERTSTKPKRAEHLKMRKSQFSSLEMSEKAESTLYRQQRPLKKDFFTLKTAFALATVVFFFCGVFVVQRYQIRYVFLAKTNVKINRHFFDSDICAMIYIA